MKLEHLIRSVAFVVATTLLLPAHQAFAETEASLKRLQEDLLQAERDRTEAIQQSNRKPNTPSSTSSGVYDAQPRWQLRPLKIRPEQTNPAQRAAEQREQELIRRIRAGSDNPEPMPTSGKAKRSYSPEQRAAYRSAKTAYEADDYPAAFKQFMQLAEAGHDDAQWYVGVMYSKGRGTSADETQAVHWFRLAAEQGDPDAQNSLATRYDQGKGVAQDSSIAARWYFTAAEQDFSDAQYYLGELFYNGRGVPKNRAAAMHWYEKSAAQGDDAALYSLAWMIEHGDEVPEDKPRALELYQQAAAKGSRAAKERLAKLGVSVSEVVRE